jgi:hypothetical protein
MKFLNEQLKSVLNDVKGVLWKNDGPATGLYPPANQIKVSDLEWFSAVLDCLKNKPLASPRAKNASLTEADGFESEAQGPSAKPQKVKTF